MDKETATALAKFAWLGLDENDLRSPLIHHDILSEISSHNVKDPLVFLLKLMADPTNFCFTCKHILNVELLPYQLITLRKLWTHAFPMLVFTRGGAKTFILAVYSILRGLFLQGRKIVVMGAAFRQAKFVMEYIERIWKNAPLLQEIIGNRGIRHETDQWVFDIGDSSVSAMPLGTGEKIRGKRANDLISDEFQSINRVVYETSVTGFSVVSADPVDRVKAFAKAAYYHKLGIETEVQKINNKLVDNQNVISGTASYIFTHFGEYWKMYKGIIESQGNTSRVRELVKEYDVSDLDHRDFCVIRLPYDLLPPGFMDEKQLNRSKATYHVGIFQCEYMATFLDDSHGFFKRSLIESCVANDINKIVLPHTGLTIFSALTRGNSRAKHIIAVDPASESDNFSIVVLELWEDHRRIVYCWSANRKTFEEKEGADKDFYEYCARKIRELMIKFPCVRIAMDAQGGGIAVKEALKTPANKEEMPIYEVIDPEDPKPTDRMPGLHMLELCQFARADWVSEANHGMRKDFEDKILLFPYVDIIQLGAGDGSTELEDVYYEIEELKTELSTIIVTKTPSGRDHWDTPEIKTAENKKGRLKKDRYSALLMANMAARTKQDIAPPIIMTAGGFVGTLIKPSIKSGQLFRGSPLAEQHQNLTRLGRIVKKRGIR